VTKRKVVGNDANNNFNEDEKFKNSKKIFFLKKPEPKKNFIEKKRHVSFFF